MSIDKAHSSLYSALRMLEAVKFMDGELNHKLKVVEARMLEAYGELEKEIVRRRDEQDELTMEQ